MTGVLNSHLVLVAGEKRPRGTCFVNKRATFTNIKYELDCTYQGESSKRSKGLFVRFLKIGSTSVELYSLYCHGKGSSSSEFAF